MLWHLRVLLSCWSFTVKCAAPLLQVGNYGIVCTGFKKQDMIVEGRVLIRVKNAANVVITPSMQAAFRFAVQIGP